MIGKTGKSVPCIICGESVELTQEEEMALFYGIVVKAKVCRSCRRAVLRMRRQMKEEKENKR